jgi:putative ABC transport system permease protein
MSFFRFLLRDLSTRKTRTLVTVAGIAVGVSVCVIVLGLSESVRRSFTNAHAKRNIDVIVLEKDEFSFLSSRVDASLAQELQTYPEVDAATGILMDFQRYQETYVPLYGWSTDGPLFDEIVIGEGRKPVAGRNEVIVGDVFAANSRKGVGTDLPIRGERFEVVGVFQSEVPFEKSALIIPLDVFQRVDADKQGLVMTINVILKDRFRNADTVRTIVERIEAAHPEVSAQDVDLFVTEKTKQIILGEKLSIMIAAITVVAVILGLSNALMTTAFERKKLMGVLIAIGWQKMDVFKAFAVESLLLSLAGGAVGTVFGFYATGHIFATMDVSVFMPDWNRLFVVKIVGIVVATALAAGIIPAWIIVHLNPVAVIKHE